MSKMSKVSSIVVIDTGKTLDNGKNPAAVALGRLGGLRGGKVRAERLSAERRREIAQAAARARWNRDAV